MKRFLVVVPAVLLLVLAVYALGTKLNKPENRTQVTMEAHKMSPVVTESKPEPTAPPEVFKNPMVIEERKQTRKPVKVAMQPTAPEPLPTAINIEPMPVAAPVTISQELITEAPSKSPFDFSFLAAHAAGKVGNTRDFSEFLIEAKYHINDQTSVGIGQEAKKLYLIAATGEDEFLPGDTRLYLSRELSPDFFTIQWNLEIGATLPVSKESRDTKHITRPYLALRASRSFFNDLLTVGYSPFVSYSFNQYATSNSGQPLQKIVFGQGVDASIAILRNRLYVKGWAKGYHRMYEEYDHSITTPGATQSFDVGSALSLKVTDQIGIDAGVTRGTSVLNSIRYDSSFYDREETRVFAAIKVSL